MTEQQAQRIIELLEELNRKLEAVMDKTMYGKDAVNVIQYE